MHLLSATRASGSDIEEPVDLDQGPGEVVILSAADSELGCLAAAFARIHPRPFTLRLANLLKLSHPYSVDLHLEKTVRHARFVLVRLLGGRSYWSYGVERLSEHCREAGIPLVLIPGDDRPDPELADWGTVPAARLAEYHAYFTAGGVENALLLLRRIAVELGREAGDILPPRPLPRAGLYLHGNPRAGLDELEALRRSGRPRALLVFYRALLQSGDLEAPDALLEALEERGIAAAAIHVTSLKDAEAALLLARVREAFAPELLLVATAFAVGGISGDPARALPIGGDAPLLQVVFAGTSREAWLANPQGLGPRDLAMQVALPEVDGRVLTRAVAFKEIARFDEETRCPLVRLLPERERVAFVAELAAAWLRLRRTPAALRRVAILLANYPCRDGRIANGVGLDTPESVARALRALADAGYGVEDPPADGQALIRHLLEGPTNRPQSSTRRPRIGLSLAEYERLFAKLPAAVREAVTARWGPPAGDPKLRDGAFPLPVLPLGNIVVAIQPARGYEVDPRATYHDPDLVPPHGYLALYLWLRHVFRAQAIVHFGKHGNLEWLPGKALALTAHCLPDAILGPMPHLYPFIVNDPGEGSQAKRRSQAVILDHLTPPLTRAGTYGDLRELERLVDEYYEASQLDPRRLPLLEEEIFAWCRRLGLDQDLGLEPAAPSEIRLKAIDNHLCELKELQIRGGLHVFGASPVGEARVDLLCAMARVPRGRGEGGDASLLRALAADLGLGGFDPLAEEEPGAAWQGPRPQLLAALCEGPWRSRGDTRERLEMLARELVAGRIEPAPDWPRTRAVLAWLRDDLAPRLDISGAREMEALLAGLDGRFVAPGPSGAPTRGRPDVLPTGRNFFSVDTRGVPTPAAFRLGWEAAERVIEHHLQLHGEWPRRIALSAWGTANMRTGGEDIAQALALLGCRPVWEGSTQRVTGIEVLPAAALGRPRVDVTLRVSGFFRDAFPAQMELFDDAVRAVAALDEPEEINPLAAAVRRERAALEARGVAPEPARRRATLRLFGSKPGAYGAGLQALLDSGAWESEEELAEAYLAWSSWAYGRGLEGEAAREAFEARLRETELVLHNQDNREHDILDSDDYYQFLGGLTAAVRRLSGRQPEVLFGDHSQPERPRVRRLQEEIGRVVRARAANPRWIRAMMRHGYKGAFELAATVDYLFGFAATTKLVGDHHFDALFAAYLLDEEVVSFLRAANPDALVEIAERFEEAIRRGLWHPSHNRVHARLDELLGRDG